MIVVLQQKPDSGPTLKLQRAQEAVDHRFFTRESGLPSEGSGSGGGPLPKANRSLDLKRPGDGFVCMLAIVAFSIRKNTHDDLLFRILSILRSVRLKQPLPNSSIGKPNL